MLDGLESSAVPAPIYSLLPSTPQNTSRRKSVTHRKPWAFMLANAFPLWHI
jgi:hypothetical protein